MKNSSFNSSLVVATVFSLSIAFSGCKKETTSTITTPTTASSTIPTSAYFLQGSFGGETVSLQGTPEPFTASFSNPVQSQPEDHDGDHDGQSNSATPLVTGTRWLDNTTTTGVLESTKGSVEIRKTVIRVFIAPRTVAQQHYDMLALGTFNFTNGQQRNNGAYVTFRDGHGVLWTSEGDQTGSTITISSRGEFAGTATTIAGMFSAKMYDSNGNVKQMNNVSFSGLAGL